MKRFVFGAVFLVVLAACNRTPETASSGGTADTTIVRTIPDTPLDVGLRFSNDLGMNDRSIVPPVVSDAVYTAGSSTDIPGIIDFQPPSRSVAEAPPPVKEEADDAQTAVSPHTVRFTVPAAVIPPAAEDEQPVSVPPRSSQPAVMVYLFPVAPEIRQRVQSALCEKLGFSAEKAGFLVSRAPAAVAGFSRKSDALAAMTELTDYGIPVSLVPDSSPDAGVSQEKSLIDQQQVLQQTELLFP